MVGLLVLVPGMDETLRISGSAQITDDQRLLAESAVQGRVPGIGLLITVRGVSSLSQSIRSIWPLEPRKTHRPGYITCYTAMLTDHVEGLS